MPCGIGYLLGFAQSQSNAPLALGLIAVVMAVVLALLALAGRIARRLLAWQNPQTDDEPDGGAATPPPRAATSASSPAPAAENPHGDAV